MYLIKEINATLIVGTTVLKKISCITLWRTVFSTNICE